MLLLIGTMLLLLVLGVEVALAIGIASVVCILVGNTPVVPQEFAQSTVGGADNFVLLAVPFFILAGELMNAGGITRRLIQFAEALVGGIRGGLAYVVVIVNMIMAGVSGAAIADAAAVGSVMVPSMVRAGYRRGFAGAVNAAAATVGPVVPPSVGFIIYASVANDPRVSVGRLFLAGAVPGFILGAYMMIVCFIVARRSKLPKGSPTSPGRVWLGLRDALWALLMPVIILGGILGGVVTPTEVGVIAVMYGLFVGCIVYREIKLADVPYLLAKSAKQTAVIMFIIAVAKTFGDMLTFMDAAETLMSVFGTFSQEPWVFLLVMNLVIIALGCFMEGGSLMIILTPLLMPILVSYGIDPVHFGVVFQLNIMIGLLTPPIGMLLYVITGVSGVPMNEILRDLWPFLAAIVVVLLLVTYVPSLALFLPQSLGSY